MRSITHSKGSGHGTIGTSGCAAGTGACSLTFSSGTPSQSRHHQFVVVYVGNDNVLYKTTVNVYEMDTVKTFGLGTIDPGATKYGDYVDGECSGVNDNIGRSVYNSDVNNYDYESSLVRTKVLDWYNNNLSKYDKYIVGGYCNEFRDINKEKYDRGTVDLMCSNIIDDKAALLTINDILFVGHGINGNYRSYLYNRDSYYTMSTYSEDQAIIIDQFGTKNLASLDSERAIRPVITIRKDKIDTNNVNAPLIENNEVVEENTNVSETV